MHVLVTGGAGYIGSHATHALLDRGDDVVVLDNLSTGRRELVAKNARFVEGDVADVPLVRDLIERNRIDAIIHFAGSIVVPDSVHDPLSYYGNNTVGSRNLIAAAVASGVERFVFSSTAAVYGDPQMEAIDETAPLQPINPYGRSKLMTEWMLSDAAAAHNFRFAALRYFNVAGADPYGRSGQSSPRATHLVKRACQCALGVLPYLDIFGTDYDTPDGTGVRDYIHVSDLASAHALALDYLADGGNSVVLNCGYGHGTSVREIIAAVETVIGRRLPVREAPRRAGDPARLIARADRSRRTLRWHPQHDDIGEIVRSAYEWEKRIRWGFVAESAPLEPV